MRTSVADIVREVAAKRGLSEKALLGHCRTHPNVRPRQEAMFRVFTECPHISYPEAGRRLGGRDHTTIMHGVKAHCARIGITYEDAKAMRDPANLRHSFSSIAARYAQAMEAARVQ